MSLAKQALDNIGATNSERAWMPLVDRHIDSPRQEEPRESMGDVQDDVRSAMDRVSAKEARQRVGDELGLQGVRAVRQWDDRAAAVGPSQAAAEAAHLYQRQPVQPKPQGNGHRDEPRNDYEHLMQSARRAVEQSKAREERRAERPAIEQELATIEQRHGGLEVIDRRKAWHESMAVNPAEAAPRIEAELAAEQQHLATFPSLLQTADQFIADNNVTQEQTNIIVEALPRLTTGDNQADLQNALAYSRWVTGEDIEDKHTREVIAAQRQHGGGVDLWMAHGLVAQFEQQHPKVKRGSATWRRMQELLEHGQARTLEEAYRAAQ
jgi:hypothetical protein